MKKLIFLSGAGLSAPSGLSTFRDSGGLWEQYDTDEVCNISTWVKNYDLVHEFYDKRRMQLDKVSENHMHKMIAKVSNLAKNSGVEVLNFTQNVDDLLERAGCTDVLHLHGELDKLHCQDCDNEFRMRAEFGAKRCEKCGGLIKPSVIFFGEQAPLYERLWAEFGSLKKDDLVVVIGTSGGVININSLLRFHSGKALLINLEKSQWIDESNFSDIWYKSCDECAADLQNYVSDWLE